MESGKELHDMLPRPSTCNIRLQSLCPVHHVLNGVFPCRPCDPDPTPCPCQHPHPLTIPPSLNLVHRTTVRARLVASMAPAPPTTAAGGSSTPSTSTATASGWWGWAQAPGTRARWRNITHATPCTGGCRVHGGGSILAESIDKSILRASLCIPQQRPAPVDDQLSSLLCQSLLLL